MPDTSAAAQQQLPDFTGLTDGDLINLLPDAKDKRDLTAAERAAIDELWTRHYEQIKQRLCLVAIYSGTSPCPFFLKREEFAEQCLSRTYMKFVAGIRKREYKNFVGYICTLVSSAAIDEQREIIGRVKKALDEPAVTVAIREHVPRQVEPDFDRGFEEEPEPDWGAHQPPSPTSITKVDQLDEERYPTRSKLPNAARLAERKQQKDIIRKLLERHASESPEAALSTATLRLHFWSDNTWTEIADRLLRAIPLSLETRAKKVERFAKKDCEQLRSVMEQEFKITDSEQL